MILYNSKTIMVIQMIIKMKILSKYSKNGSLLQLVIGPSTVGYRVSGCQNFKVTSIIVLKSKAFKILELPFYDDVES